MVTAYLYHIVPSNMEGAVLFPLNRLKEIKPHLFAEHFAKYQGRERITKTAIPLLNCLWNDVVQFSPVHPRQIRDAMILAGYNWKPMKWLQIDPITARFTDKNTAIWLHHQHDVLQEKDIEPFSVNRLESLSTLPQTTKDYYCEMHLAAKRPLLYKFMPHVFHLGAIEININEYIDV